MKLPTGCRSIDKILEGGVESSIITEFYGEYGSGKTNLCMQLARNCIRYGKKTIYIDTEGISVERFEQICGKDFEKAKNELLLFSPYSFEEQERMVRDLEKIPNAGLIIVDTINMFYRVEYIDDSESATRSLARQLVELYLNARRRDIPVVITSQVYTSSETGSIEPFAGRSIEHIAKAIVKLEKIGMGRRKAVIIKHRSIAEGVSAEFMLTRRGVESL